MTSARMPLKARPMWKKPFMYGYGKLTKYLGLPGSTTGSNTFASS